ncbi:hypothetical protein Droror1_Dr00000446 [Drosera rotundifolia]
MATTLPLQSSNISNTNAALLLSPSTTRPETHEADEHLFWAVNSLNLCWNLVVVLIANDLGFRVLKLMFVGVNFEAV